MTDPIVSLLRARGGLATTAQLRSVGLDGASVTRAVRAGRIVRVRRGAFALPVGFGSPTVAHSTLAAAMVAELGEELVLTHTSAAVAAGLPTYGVDLRTVHLGAWGRPSRRRSRPGLVLHHLPDRLERRAGSVSPAVASVQLGLLGGAESFLVTADAALRAGARTDELRRAVEAYRRTPGVGALHSVVPLADGRRESAGESRLAWALHLCGIAVDAQVDVIAGGRRYRPDFVVRGEKVLIEFDGLGKYDDRMEIRRERAREADLVGDGWQVVRVQWPDLDDLGRLSQLVEAAKARARRLAGW